MVEFTGPAVPVELHRAASRQVHRKLDRERGGQREVFGFHLHITVDAGRFGPGAHHRHLAVVDIEFAHRQIIGRSAKLGWLGVDFPVLASVE